MTHTFVITGATSGLGRLATRILSASDADIIAVGRDRARAEQLQRETGCEVVLGDLTRLSEVHRVADAISARTDRIDALINNAGIYEARRHITPDGFERTFAVNHLAHFLLTNLLHDLLVAACGRVIVLTSAGHIAGDLRRAPLEDIARGRVRYHGLRAYGDSKLANLLFAFELARRWRRFNVTANALHPGTLRTPVWRDNRDLLSIFMKLAQPFLPPGRRGGERIARLATDAALNDVTGTFFDKDRPGRAAAQAYDEDLAGELWQKSVQWTGLS